MALIALMRRLWSQLSRQYETPLRSGKSSGLIDFRNNAFVCERHGHQE